MTNVPMPFLPCKRLATLTERQTSTCLYALGVNQWYVGFFTHLGYARLLRTSIPERSVIIVLSMAAAFSLPHRFSFTNILGVFSGSSSTDASGIYTSCCTWLPEYVSASI